MSEILIKNGLIVTMNRSREIIRGSVLIKGSEIEKVGNVESEDAEKVIDAQGKIVMPGLVCAHTKPYGILLRAAPLKVEPSSDFIQILHRIWWQMDERLSEEDIYASTLSACLESIKSGVTFLACTHSSQGSIGKSLDQVASAIEESGLRALVGFEASERYTRAKGARGMKENIRFLENIQKKSWRATRVRGMVGLDASFEISDELLRHGKRVADRFNVPIIIPAAEGKVDQYHNLEKYGKRTIERFRDIGLLSHNTVLAGCVHLNEDELSIIRKNGSKVAHNPMSNMLNGTGVAPVPKMRSIGIPVGLGNGGYQFDGFENIRSLYLVHKAVSEDPRTISPMEALEMATIRSAELYGIENKIGSIEPGKRADLIMIDPSSLPTALTRENVVDHIVHSIRASDVESMIVGGDLIMKNRNIKTLDEKWTLRKSKKIAKNIWKNFEV